MGEGREAHGERGICIRIADSLRCTAETNTTIEINCSPTKT